MMNETRGITCAFLTGRFLIADRTAKPSGYPKYAWITRQTEHQDATVPAFLKAAAGRRSTGRYRIACGSPATDGLANSEGCPPSFPTVGQAGSLSERRSGPIAETAVSPESSRGAAG